MTEQDDPIISDAAAIRWVLLADARRARLLRCGLTEQGRCRVEEHGSIDNTWPGHEHGRSARVWKNATITFGMEDDEGEDLRRFAREVVARLEHRMGKLGIRRIHILASPRFLGVLRKVRPRRLAGQLILKRKADLMHLNAGKLAKHPVIRQLIASDRSEGSEDRRDE